MERSQQDIHASRLTDTEHRLETGKMFNKGLNLKIFKYVYFDLFELCPQFPFMNVLGGCVVYVLYSEECNLSLELLN